MTYGKSSKYSWWRKEGRKERGKEGGMFTARTERIESEERVSIKNGRPVHRTLATSQIQFNIQWLLKLSHPKKNSPGL